MSKGDVFQAYITKYALTDGVYLVDVELVDDHIVALARSTYRYLYFRKDWHRTEAEALARVQEMIRKRLISLDKSKAKLVDLLVKCDNVGLPMATKTL